MPFSDGAFDVEVVVGWVLARRGEPRRFLPTQISRGPTTFRGVQDLRAPGGTAELGVRVSNTYTKNAWGDRRSEEMWQALVRDQGRLRWTESLGTAGNAWRIPLTWHPPDCVSLADTGARSSRMRARSYLVRGHALLDVPACGGTDDAGTPPSSPRQAAGDGAN